MTWFFLILGWLLAATLGWAWLAQNARWQRLERLIVDLRSSLKPQSCARTDSLREQRVVNEVLAISEERNRLRRKFSHGQFDLTTILSSMVESVVVVDAAQLVRLVNQSFLAMFDVSASPLQKSIDALVRNMAVSEMICAALESGGPQSREVALGDARYLSGSAVPLKAANGEVSGAVVIFHDISRIKRLEELRREFVANVSHELRTPLSIFHGYLENLIDHPEVPREELAEILQILQRHSLRLNALLEDLLVLGRLEARQESLTTNEIDVLPFLEMMAKDWQQRCETKRIALRVDANCDLPPLMADRAKLERVFHNLIENAIKYADSDIVLSGVRVEDSLEMAVSDNGAGIVAEDLPHIFERFYRGDKSRSRGQGGTGLGLSIVKHLVQMHGGTVRAESRPSEGTKIVINLPL